MKRRIGHEDTCAEGCEVGRIVSFAWTSAALLAGHKTVTRRNWSADYGRLFRKGDVVHAYDRSPRVHGKPIARLRLTVDAHHESDASTPDRDYEAEGFAWYVANPDGLPKRERFAYLDTVSWESFCRWRERGGSSWVVRFEVAEVLLAEPAIQQIVLGI